MTQIDISTDLNMREERGYVWTLLSEAANPSLIVPGAIVTAGEDDAIAVCQVIDLKNVGDDVMVSLAVLPGQVADYVDLARRLAG